LACLLIAAPPARAQDPVIAAAGDIACDPTGASFNNGDGEPTRCRQKYTSDLLVGAGLSSVLALGDNQYEEGTLEQFQGSYDLSWGRVKSITRPVIGNHEYFSGNGGIGHWDYFNGVGSDNGPAGERGKGWYSFDVGDWHLIALNSMCPQVGGCEAGSEQEQWLRADLAANSDAACTIAYWHHPLFNSGPEASYADTPWNTTALWEALYESGADLVLSAHAHRYERFAPQDPFGGADPQFGLREFVVGTGGSTLQPADVIQPNSEFGDSTHFGVLMLVLKANGYDWNFVSDAGATVDSGSGSCHADAQPPDTSVSDGPEGLIADRSVDFSFAASEFGSSFRCRLNGPGPGGGDETGCDSPHSYSDLADGEYTFRVFARDASDNADPSPATRSFAIDATAPNTSISLGPRGATSETSLNFFFGASEEGATFECRLDGGDWASCVSPVSYEGLADGRHRFEARGTDPLGNTEATPAGRAFTVDTTPFFRPSRYEITSGRARRGRRSKRRLYVDDRKRLEIRAARKLSGSYLSAFRVFVPIGTDARRSLRSLTLNYNGGTNARNALVKLQVFNFRARRWVKVFERRGRRERSFDWSAPGSGRKYVSSRGVVRLRVQGSRRGDPFRIKADLVEVALTYAPAP
jgi:hypothetical protein